MRDQSKPQQSTATKYDMNDCLLESENFQITKSDNNKYLLLPVKKQQQFVLKECGKDFDNRNLLSLTHTQTHLISFFENKIRKKNQKLFVTTTLPHISLSLFMLYVDIERPSTTVGAGRASVRSHHYVFTE